MSAALELVRSRLEGCGCNPRGENRIESRCPAHEDRDPSLSVSVGDGDDGQVLLHCHAGCNTLQIISALGLSWPDLWDEPNGRPDRKITATYDYVDESGELLYQAVRFVPKGFCQRRPDGNGGWVWKLGDVRRVLYRLPRVLAAVEAGERIWIAEGEKDVNVLEQAGAVATCNPMGAGKWRPEYAAVLEGANVIVIADSDEPGLKHAREVVRSLQGVAMKVVLVGVPKGRKDASEHLAAGGKLAELEPLEMPTRDESELSGLTIEQVLAKAGVSEEELGDVGSVKDLLKLLGRGKRNVATEMVEAVKAAGAVLWHDGGDRAYATIEVDGHRETHAIRSRSFKLFARRAYYKGRARSRKGDSPEPKGAPSGQAVTDACAQLEAEALFDGARLDVHLRVACVDGAIFVDLADIGWRCVHITRDGWQVLDDHPVRFRRSAGMAALPEPTRGGSIDVLRTFLNIADDDAWRLIVGFLIAAFRPGSPCPVLVLHGEQGSAKSSAAKAIRSLVDPNASPLRSAPRSNDDLMVSAASGWCIAYDNLSRLEPWLSDAICRLSTGGGLQEGSSIPTPTRSYWTPSGR